MNDSGEDRRNKEADEAWAEYRRTGEFVSNEAMAAWLEAWGTDQEFDALRRLWHEGLNSGPSRFAGMAEIKEEARRRLDARKGQPE